MDDGLLGRVIESVPDPWTRLGERQRDEGRFDDRLTVIVDRRPGLLAATSRPVGESFGVAVDEVAGCPSVGSREPIRREEEGAGESFEPVTAHPTARRMRTRDTNGGVARARVATNAVEQAISRRDPVFPRPSRERRPDAVVDGASVERGWF